MECTQRRGRQVKVVLGLGEACGAASELGVGVRSTELCTGLCWVTMDRDASEPSVSPAKLRYCWGWVL